MKKTILANLLAMTAFFGSFANAEEAQTQRVVVSSYGESVEAATKNAATAALEQVVGSFIDANTLITKRQEISEGLLQQTKSISQNINNYSNGAIEKLTVVNTEQNGQLYKVTVDAVVRMTELKVVLGGLVAKTKVDGQGLFAQIQTKKQQTHNLEQIYIDNFIKPQQDGSAYEIDIGQPFLAEQAPTVSEREYCLDLQRAQIREGKTMVFLPVTVKLKEVFLEKFKTLLKETASDPVAELCSIYDCQKIPKSYERSIYNIHFLGYIENNLNGIFFRFARQNNGDFNSYPGLSESEIFFVKSLSPKNIRNPGTTFVVDVKDSNGETILYNSFPYSINYEYSSFDGLFDAPYFSNNDNIQVFLPAGERGNITGRHYTIAGNYVKDKKCFYIDAIQKYYVVLQMEDIGRVSNIEVSIRPKS